MKYRPVIPYIGGKTRLAKEIIPLFQEHICYVEPFCGAAGIFFAKEPSEVEVLNDINGELINLYRVIQNHLEEFIRQFKWALSSRQVFEWQKMTVPETLTDIKRAARFFYLQKSGFGGRVEGQSFGTGTTSGPRLNLLRIEEDLSQAHLRLSGVYVEHLNWEKCIEKYDRPHTLFFCDPPYFGTEGYGVPFGLDEYRKMAKLARSIKGKMVITINDIPEMLDIFQGLPMGRVSIAYTCTNQKTNKAKQSSEQIIRNFTAH